MQRKEGYLKERKAPSRYIGGGGGIGGVRELKVKKSRVGGLEEVGGMEIGAQGESGGWGSWRGGS